MAESYEGQDVPGLNTRLDPRYPAAELPAITAMRLSPGDAVTLVNISASGVLVEGRTRLVPGTRLNVLFEGPVTPGRVRGRVVRCKVAAITGGLLHYHTGIAFEGRVDLPVTGTRRGVSAGQTAAASHRQAAATAERAREDGGGASNQW